MASGDEFFTAHFALCLAGVAPAVRQAKVVFTKDAPELVSEVRRGDVSVSAAAALPARADRPEVQPGEATP